MDDKPICLMRIQTNNYVAGIEWIKKQTNIKNKLILTDMVYTINRCAPILNWLLRKPYSFDWVCSFFRVKGYDVTLTYHDNPQDNDWLKTL